MKTKLRSQQGASVVEFALILPLLVVLIFGIIEFSLALYDKAIITNASREGARVGVVARWDTSVTPARYNPLHIIEIQTTMNNYLSNHLVTFGGTGNWEFNPPITRCPDPPLETPSLPSSGSELVVTVVYPYTFLVLPRFLTGLTGTINFRAETRMRCE